MTHTHGMSGSAIYRVWGAMVERCTKQASKDYAHYGGRGITVCDRWRKFENFYADMGDRPTGMTLERIDNDGDYEPGNCRWATRREQNLNRRTTQMVTYLGETLCAADWERRFGYGEGVVAGRLRRGWPIERALTQPVRGTVNKSKAKEN